MEGKAHKFTAPTGHHVIKTSTYLCDQITLVLFLSLLARLHSKENVTIGKQL
jgi:hypothetical protein